MNNEQYQQIIDEAYENFIDEVDSMWKKSDVGDLDDFIYDGLLISGTDENGEWFARIPTKEEFINRIKTNEEFSKKWGLKIEERELSLEERSKIWDETHNPAGNIYTHSQYNENNLPTKLIAIMYKGTTTEVYE